ncbi:MAG: S41 family peptidase [Peptostreptococcaceae bacterium]|nr:S41 family peptidase [Peptostreptococcaceae bacterium]
MKDKKQLILGIFLGVFLSILAFCACITSVTRAYGLSVKEYQELSQFQELTKKLFYQDAQDVDFTEGMKKGIVESLKDPYSRYMNAEEFKKMMEDTTGNFIGIGVYIAPKEDNTIVVISPIKSSPAEKVGIKSGDIISDVNGKKYDASTMQEAVKAMRGKEGEKVKIGIISSGKYKEYTIKREPIHQQTVSSKIIDKNIGYIQIIAFEEKTAEEFRKNYSDLKKQNIKSLIIDIRSNPGGMLDQVIDIANQILPKSTIMYTNNKNDEKNYMYSDDKESIKLPIVVLVNGGSASSSEILAGALQDNKAATILGTKTYGKGVIQTIMPLSDGGGLSITTAQYYTPNGKTVHKKGIIPDVKIDLKATDKEDVQLKKAIDIIKKKMK